MGLLAHLLIPHVRNNHHPHLLRPHGLGIVFLFLILVSLINNQFFSERQKVLGFATNIKSEELINLTNKEREKKGLPTLKENSILSQAASLKAKDMFSKNYWAHVSPDGTTPWEFFKSSSYFYSHAGENLARDFYTSSAVVSAWMESSSHRENILNKSYEEIGMAVIDGVLEGEETTLIVQFFGTPQKPLLSSISSDQTANSSVTGETEGQPSRVAAELKPTGSKPLAVLPDSSRDQSGLNLKPLPLETLTTTQKIYVAVLLLLLVTLIVDSFILFKRRINRQGSHSVLHAGLILLLIVLIIYSSRGAII
jgi:uncharacterized protein YkwD